MEVPSRSKGVARTGTSSRYLLNRLGIRKLVINLCQKVIDVNRLPVNDSPAQGSSTVNGSPTFGAGWHGTEMSYRWINDLTIHPVDDGIGGTRIVERRSRATTSSTGWISVGELAMTPKISLVAVCCSRRIPLSSWNSRTFSMAMTA